MPVPAIHHDGYLYGSSGRHTENAELRCVEWATGTVKWSEQGLTRASLLYVDGHFVCLSEDGSLRLLRLGRVLAVVSAGRREGHRQGQRSDTKDGQTLHQFNSYTSAVLRNWARRWWTLPM